MGRITVEFIHIVTIVHSQNIQHVCEHIVLPNRTEQILLLPFQLMFPTLGIHSISCIQKRSDFTKKVSVCVCMCLNRPYHP